MGSLVIYNCGSQDGPDRRRCVIVNGRRQQPERNPPQRDECCWFASPHPLISYLHTALRRFTDWLTDRQKIKHDWRVGLRVIQAPYPIRNCWT